MIAKTLLAILAAGSALASPTPADPEPTWSVHLNKREQGTSDGFFYSNWNDGKGSVTFTNGAAGNYKVEWSDVGNVVVGK